jgi:hypothetical protein
MALNKSAIIFFFLHLFTINKLMIMHPVQLPLHEPYFDLTPIKVTHTKVTIKLKYNYLYKIR